MKDYPLMDISVHLVASKNREYRETTFAYYKAFAGFLQTNGLVVHALLEEGETPSENFKIMRSSLTDEGFVFIQKALDKWLTAISSGKTKPDDTKILEKALKSIRK